jgi:hypothetical protein
LTALKRGSQCVPGLGGGIFLKPFIRSSVLNHHHRFSDGIPPRSGSCRRSACFP